MCRSPPCRRRDRPGLAPGVLWDLGGAVAGALLPGDGGDRAGPAPLTARAPRLPERNGHCRPEAGAHSLCPPEPQDRLLPGEVCTEVWEPCAAVRPAPVLFPAT